MEGGDRTPPRIGIIGSGSWATAIASLLTWREQPDAQPIRWWIRRQEALDHILATGHNPHYLRSLTLKRNRLALSSDLNTVVEDSDILILAVPSAHLDTVLEAQPLPTFKDKVVFSAIKGLVSEDHHIPARYLHKVMGVPYDRLGLISGPSHAEEVAREQWTYLTLACPDVRMAESLAGVMANPWLHIRCNDDLFGIELAAVLKNVYAIAAGVSHGLGIGDNFNAVLIASALNETERFLNAVNSTSRDLSSSAYLGDLLVTAYSPHSRNRTLGTMVGKGYSVPGALMEMGMVAEGYRSALGINRINQKFGVDMPVAEAVYRILHEQVAPSIEMRILSDRIH